MSFQFKKTIKLLAVSCTTSFCLITVTNAAPPINGEIPNKRGFSVESMDSMRLPGGVKKELLDQINQTSTGVSSVVSEENFTSLTKIVEVMSAKDKNVAPSFSSIVGGGKLISHPSSTDGTLLDDAALLSVTTSGVYQNGQWSGLSRIYSTKEFGTIMLDENDYVSVGGSIVMAKEAINESVNSAPAILVTKRSVSGETLIQLTWVTNRKDYLLSSNAPDIAAGKAALLTLARSIKD